MRIRFYAQTCNLVDWGFCYSWLPRGNFVYDFPYPSDGDRALCACGVMHPERVYLVVRTQPSVACLRAVLPEPTYAHTLGSIYYGPP